MNVIIGVDPGKTGGIAWFDLTTNIVECVKMPDTNADILAQVRKIAAIAGPGLTIAFLEDVEGNAGGCKTAQQGFRFGAGFGDLRTSLLATGVATRKVRPQTWQSALSLGKCEGDDTTAWKNKLKQRAQEFYPNVPGITKATADALLIMEYGRRQFQQGVESHG